ncbi:restriction endonuclease subunit S [Mailhella sp.]|uniref:restriction endonuclease subunit S n=1 Tax=Mailhella sp. TaxID=1981029 RepID=UPI004063F098
MARPRKNAPKPNTQELSLVPVEEQPYPLPEGWKWVRLGSVLSASKEKTEDFSSPSLRYVGLEHIEKDNGIIGSASAEGIRSLKNIFHPGQILYGKLRPYLNKHDIADFEGVCSTDILVFDCSNIVISKFINYFFNLSYFKEYTVTNSKGINLPRVSEQTVLNAVFPLPPLDVQERIVTRIESLFAKLDEAKKKAEAVLDSYETRKAAILHKAFTEELTHTRPTSFQPITNFIKKTKNSLKAGPFGSALKKDFYVASGYKIYGQEQVISGDENFGDYYINEEKYQELISCKIEPRDVLISLVGTVGKVLVLSENCKPGIINPRLIKITLDQTKMLPEFFSYYFQSDEVKASHKESSHGTTMDVLNMGILKQINFPCFTILEQQEITRILDSILEKEQQSKEAAETVLEQIDLMKKAILAKAFRGELG